MESIKVHIDECIPTLREIKALFTPPEKFMASNIAIESSIESPGLNNRDANSSSFGSSRWN